MPSEGTAESESRPVPAAIVREKTPGLLRNSRLWWITAVCALVAVALTVASLGPAGTPITVTFEQGYGLKPGDRVRYRGIDVGEVAETNLETDLGRIAVEILLYDHGLELAREGTVFWIERPQLSLPRISGLETAMGGKYLRVRPGPAGGARQTLFVGREVPSTMLDPSGVVITIRFERGHGLSVGDSVRHRGITVGEVTDVRLTSELNGVVVTARLKATAQQLARVGSLFWVERPRLSLREVSGLETIVGGRHIAVQPGPKGAEEQTEFEGTSSRPALVHRTARGLEIVLESPHRQGVEAGAPVTYRGLAVGRIVSVGLAGDSTRIEIRAYIEPAYRSLVRENTQFWATSGIDLEFGLMSGVRLSADSLATIAAGGVSFATPDDAGSEVKTGERFSLQREADVKDPLKWQPRLPSGVSMLPEGASLPRNLKAALHWKVQRLVQWNRQSTGFVLPLSDGRLLGPLDVLVGPAGTVDDSVRLELEGAEYDLPAEPDVSGELAFVRPEPSLPESLSRWPASRLRSPTEPEDCLIVFGSGQRIVTKDRLKVAEDAWELDDAYPVDAQWHGAALVAVGDGCVLGLLIVDEESGQARAALLPTPAGTAGSP